MEDQNKTTHVEALRRCAPEKTKYDRCFNSWYRYSFLQGNMTNACDDYFEDYKACILGQLGEKGLEHLAPFDPPQNQKQPTEEDKQ